MPLSLSPLDAVATVVERCERLLVVAILRGELREGERVPPERELAERWQVARSSVRDALGRLASRGLVRSRQGSGHVVADWRRVGGPDLLPELARSDAEAAPRRAADTLAVRRAIAGVVLAALPDPVDPAALVALTASIDALEREVRLGAPPNEIAEVDVEVARAVVACTGRDTLALCLNPVAGVLLAWPELQRAMFADPGSNVLAWRALAGWIAASPRPPSGPWLVAMDMRDAETVSRIGGGR